MANFLKGIIDRIEGDFLVIKISGDQEIYWPKKSIDFNISEGDQINLFLSKDEPETQKTLSNTKDLLKQIFQPNA